MAPSLRSVWAGGKTDRDLPKRFRLRTGLFLVAALAIFLWLAIPAARILWFSGPTWHTHTVRSVLRFSGPEGILMGHGKTDLERLHQDPFWPKYARSLVGQDWPGDYVCPAALYVEGSRTIEVDSYPGRERPRGSTGGIPDWLK